MDTVCARCFSDPDVKQWIREYSGKRGCRFCRGFTSPTAPLGELCEWFEQVLSTHYGRAADNLPWNNREGGYQGSTWSTYELLFEKVGLDLPMDYQGDLQKAINYRLSDEIWCELDWATLDEEQAMCFAWDNFCTLVKHERRFFFHKKGGDDLSAESFSSLGILNAIADLIERLNLVRVQTPGLRLYRARPGFDLSSPTAKDFGPPPRSVCQTNRMNPAGIPMFYGALDPRTAVKEVKARASRVGYFQTVEPLRILDLSRIPPVPGIFSDEPRRLRLYLSFLHHFASDIMQPVARDDRVHTEYVPSQIVTEYLREHEFSEGKLDGIMYGSVASPRKRNLVIFIEDIEPAFNFFQQRASAPLKFIKAKNVNID
ncbi:HEPN-associated N-terminal domain-containing protein [Pseudomonas synxantha]|uniref:RES domain-containing protein n=1 Tax=Pseudomonas synxantha TaxID=47883 RepID=A0ABS0ULS1_9PSED|nr:HEPN-associated N-terminal domain-containing protein [Pseudomonas synxantha]MBI6566551.1 RES domain-containing protein [Pseudomonas synxantha]MBI6584198.1 RES domain-containing protein [Pseudomonas synxantha]MBI6643493.1 RES domain-containing protein [Pseudomonas synxantha]